MNDSECIKWTVIPCQKNPRKTLLVSLFILAIWISVYLVYGVFWTFLAILMLFSTVAPYYLPTTYILSNEIITIQKYGVRHTRRWDYFRRYHILPDGVFLSPFERPNRRDNFRGTFLPFSEDNQKIITDMVQRNIVQPS